MRARQEGSLPPGRTAGVGGGRQGPVQAKSEARGSLGLSPRVAAQNAVSRWVRPSEAGGCAPETLVISFPA